MSERIMGIVADYLLKTRQRVGKLFPFDMAKTLPKKNRALETTQNAFASHGDSSSTYDSGYIMLHATAFKTPLL